MATTTGSNQTQYSTADIQRNLGGLAVDNQYGAQTTAAVKAFQTANGLTADGIFGPKTLAAFQAKYGTNSGTPTVTPQTNAGTLGTNAYQVPPAPTYGSLATELGTQVQNAQGDVTTAETTQNQGMQDWQKLSEQLMNQTADTQQAEQQVGLPQLNTDLRDLQNLSKSQTAKYIQGIQNLEVKGGAAINVNAKEAFLNRQNAIDSMLTNSLISAKSGDIQTAQSQVDRAISLKYDPIKQQIQNKLDFLKLNADNLSRADKKLADAKSTKLQLQLKQIDEQQQNEKDIRNLALTAIQKGGAPSSIMSQITGKSFEEATAVLAPYLKDPSIQLDMAIKRQQSEKLKKETYLLGEPSKAEKEATQAAIVNAKTSIPATQNKIDAVDALLNGRGIYDSVGPNILTRGNKGAFRSATGENQAFAGGVHKLVSGLTLDSLINAKKQGATFGALSDSELNILANSASAINDWEIKDKNGKGTGVWNIDEETFKKELKNIQDLSRKALVLSQGNVLSQDEQSLLDNTFSSQATSDPASYY